MWTRSARSSAARRALCASLAALALGARALAEAPAGAAPAVAAARASGGAVFLSEEGGFRATFPETPRFDDRREATLLGMLRTRSWDVERGALRLRVERHDVPALAARLLGGEALLERAARDLLEDLGARAVQEEPAPWRGHPGRRLRYEPGDRPGEREEARIVVAGRRVYVVFARAAAEAQALAAAFAASVELLE